MSFSIVRTCRRCGSRSERDVTTTEQVALVTTALLLHLRHPDSDDGCPICDPELAKRPQADLDNWQRSVDRARQRDGS